ncbi:MAG: PhoH family protein [Microbacteriaceae bacterium]
MVQLLGPNDQLLLDLEQASGVKIHARGDVLTLKGEKMQVLAVEHHLATEVQRAKHGQGYSGELKPAPSGQKTDLAAFGEILVSSRGKNIRAKTAGQKAYVEAIEENTIVFGIGPAGTGKTYLAMAKAVQALQRKEVSRIILTRPAVEAGERLGFLPGSLTEKIDPYLRPLFDALNEMMDPELVSKLMTLGTIEVAPLAYMRGRTLNDAFVILDEAQNTTAEQMKMFLTRLGFGSKMVVTGDITQIDLPGGSSGLKQVQSILNDVDDLEFAFLGSEDVVRHNLVAAIVEAYGNYSEQQNSKTSPKSRSKGPLS